MLNTIVSIFLITTLVMQIVLIMYMLITAIKRDREDKKFWDNMHKEIEESNRKYLNFLEENCNNYGECEQIEDKK